MQKQGDKFACEVRTLEGFPAGGLARSGRVRAPSLAPSLVNPASRPSPSSDGLPPVFDAWRAKAPVEPPPHDGDPGADAVDAALDETPPTALPKHRRRSRDRRPRSQRPISNAPTSPPRAPPNGSNAPTIPGSNPRRVSPKHSKNIWSKVTWKE
jgi:hypothetical protein